MSSRNRTQLNWAIRICIVVAAFLTSLLYRAESGFGWEVLAALWLVGTLLNGLLWTVLVWWVKRVRRQFPAIGQTRWRVLATFGGYLFFITLEHLLLNKLVEVSGWVPMPADPMFFLKQSFVDLLWIVVLGVTFEVLYFLKKYKGAFQEAEAAKKVALQSQFDRLKNRVNPHFLFNSLNTLSLLIEDDPQQAGEFLDELSGVYRYLLQHTDYRLVPLRSEVRFIRSYFHLLRTRFGDALDLEINVEEEALAGHLPPLSLQSLVDNALNHNVVLPERPLKLSINAPSGYYVDVSNSLQRKNRLIAPEAGLSAVMTRFMDLGLSAPRILDDGEMFTVRLPLRPRPVSFGGAPEHIARNPQNPTHP